MPPNKNCGKKVAFAEKDANAQWRCCNLTGVQKQISVRKVKNLKGFKYQYLMKIAVSSPNIDRYDLIIGLAT